MFKDILLCKDGSTGADVAADYAVWLAGKSSARIHALHVTDIRLLEGPWLTDLAGAIGAQAYAGLTPQLEQIQREKADTILAAVVKKCESHGIPCEVTHETGTLVPQMLAHEHRADLVVLGQHGEHASWSGGMLGSSVERVVRASIKPALVTPDSFRPIRRILLAYDGSAGSQKALQAVKEIAPTLEAEVTLITACHRDTEESASNILREAQQELTVSQIKVHAQLAHGDAEVEILQWALEAETDLIVMGAYGHTRIREFVLGSTTAQVIRKATMPVLLARS